MSDIWKPVHQPTRRELEERRKAEAEAKSKPGPYDRSKPGFMIDSEGKMSYDPALDPDQKAYKT